MKNIKEYTIVKIMMLAMLVGLMVTGCKKNENENLETPRIFKPGEVSISAGQTSAKLKWVEPIFSDGKPLTYTVDFSTDQTFATIAYTKVVDTAGITVTDENLQTRTPYYARIKANAYQGQPESKYMISEPFQITGLQLFKAVQENDLTRTGATLRFTATTGLTSIVLKPTTGATVTVPLTAGDAAAGFKAVTGLTAQTAYTATLMLGTRTVGVVEFTTLAPLPTGADVVTLTATDDLAAKIQAATASTRFVLLQGTQYNSDATVVLPAGIDISIIGEAGPVKPIVSLSLITLPTTGGKLHFENVDVTGYANGNAATTKRQYLINQGTASVMEQISFENCNLRNFVNTPFRLQGSNNITINKLIVNRCVVSDIGVNGSTGTYAFITATTATCKFNNITLTNSTFKEIGYGLIVHSAAPSVAVAIENNTFYNVIGNGRYLIDYSTQVVSSSYTFKSNIIGKTYAPANTGRGMRGGTTPVAESNYLTTDAVISANPIPQITNYSGTSLDLFTDPAAGDFKIKDNTFAGRSSVGDPRGRL
ncbi:DUF5123 domain-containing protein [Pedobacter sp. SL55]|uniref:DUF5123 domain-containing protein n=1 Tax=Pedobacter sp. SL55 TaxID=2995161 RepID=UPI002270F4B8|nr:DUF5123 domain-containing protein [Pedobacter sp. SL55]WAC40338.1 DUF5123 domain-containing protein [Pedobacter sp. SL55]